MTLIREIIIVLSSHIPNKQEVLSQVINEANFATLDIKSRVSFTAVVNLSPAKIKGHKSKLIRNPLITLFLKKWLHSFLGCISWGWSHLSSKSSLYYFLSVLDECKYFLDKFDKRILQPDWNIKTSYTKSRW